jgi:DNA excision repair protein ERCC-5
LFYKIKPVFVFDGKAPDLKKETLQRRRLRKGDASKKSRVASAKILDNYVRSQAVALQLKRQTHAINQVCF